MDTRCGDAFGPTLSHRSAREDDSRYQEGPQSRAGTRAVSAHMQILFSIPFVPLYRLIHLGALRWRLPQALGQCRKFITAHLPEARLINVASTAAAAEMVSTRDDAAADSAAICSKICLQLFGNLEILHEGIQDEHSELNSNSIFSERWLLTLGPPHTDCIFRSSFLFLFQFKIWIER